MMMMVTLIKPSSSRQLWKRRKEKRKERRSKFSRFLSPSKHCLGFLPFYPPPPRPTIPTQHLSPPRRLQHPCTPSPNPQPSPRLSPSLGTWKHGGRGRRGGRGGAGGVQNPSLSPGVRPQARAIQQNIACISSNGRRGFVAENGKRPRLSETITGRKRTLGCWNRRGLAGWLAAKGRREG